MPLANGVGYVQAAQAVALGKGANADALQAAWQLHSLDMAAVNKRPVANGENGIRQLFDVDSVSPEYPIGDRRAVCTIAKGAQRLNHAFIMAICAKECKLSSPPIFGRFLVGIVPVCAQEGHAVQARCAQRPKVLLAPLAHVAV